MEHLAAQRACRLRAHRFAVMRADIVVGHVGNQVFLTVRHDRFIGRLVAQFGYRVGMTADMRARHGGDPRRLGRCGAVPFHRRPAAVYMPARPRDLQRVAAMGRRATHLGAVLDDLLAHGLQAFL